MKQRSFSNARAFWIWPPDPVRQAGQRANTAPADANPGNPNTTRRRSQSVPLQSPRS